MYTCLLKNTFQFETYSIRPIQREDMENIRVWRNSQLKVLRQKKELSIEDQDTYFTTIIEPLFLEEKPSQLLFCFFKDDAFIGYGGLVYLQWEDKRAEVSFLLDPERTHDHTHYRKDFLGFLSLIRQVSFDTLKLNRIVTETYAFRKDHMKVLEEFGFKVEGTLVNNILLDGVFVDSILHAYLKKNYQ
jgi:RimJ/RimL family protein N-acetyltransferase